MILSLMIRRSVLRIAGGIAAASLLFAPGLIAQPQGRGQINEPDNPALRGFRWRSIGPVGQGGRVDDVAVDEKNPSTYYIGFAVGGIEKTVNNGVTFESIFDTYGSASIADIALAPSNPNIVYVATGEANNRQTSSYGDGMYKSTDAGATFTNIGLRNTQSLGRVIVHPTNPDIVWVAAGGHLYGPNPDRGVFMTTDGGRTWNKTLFVDENTSATEIIIDPSNPNNLWAAMYQRQRTAWGFAGGGPGSGLYSSTDGGRTWTRMSGGGLPRGTMGRIGLDIVKSNPNVIYAQIEVAPDKEQALPPAPAGDPGAGRGGRGGGGGGGGGGRGGGGTPNPQSSGVWRSNDKGRTWTFMSNQNPRPMYFSQIRADPNNADVVYIGGVDPTKSVDGGRTWSGLNNMGHVDNHSIWINPNNSNHVIYGNDGGIDVSYDAGETWDAVRMWAKGLPYHVSADMRHPYHVCTGLQDNGSWCGPSSTRTGGIHMWNWISVGGGDGFQTQIDPTDPNIFYTESQNGNISRYDLNTGQSGSIRPRGGGAGGRGGGGGGGGGGRGAGGGGGRGSILNPPPPGTVMQFNWNSPIRLSNFNPMTLLFGGRQLFISRDRGDSWTMTKDLGKNVDLDTRQIMGQPYNLPGCGQPGVQCILSKHDGYVNNEFGTLTEIAESPLLPGVIWAGTDDGNVQVTQDMGFTWTEVGVNMPGVNHEYYVSGIEASWYDAATAYVSLDGHRNNDLKPYVFKTTDYGRTWTSISSNLPAMGNVNSIRQDPVNQNLLYAPTELGFFISLNDGGSWSKFMPNLPTGRVDEVLVHPRENDLILATHSRSIWIMDDISMLQQLPPTDAQQDVILFQPRDAVLWATDRKNSTEIPGDRFWSGEVAPRGTAISYFLRTVPAGEVLVKITSTATGQDIRTCVGSRDQGMNRFQWNLSGDPQGGGGGGGGRGQGGGGGGRGAGAAAPPAGPPPGPSPCSGGGGGGGGRGRGGGGGGVNAGVYRVSLSVGGSEVGSHLFNIVPDIWLNEKQ